MFLTSRFRSRRAADSSPLCDPTRQPRTSSSYAAARSLQAFVHLLLGQVFRHHVSRVFRLLALSRWSAHGVPLPLAPTRLGNGDVSLAPLRALRQSPSTLWRPRVHLVSPPLTCQQSWPLRPELSMHSWSKRKTQLRLNLSPPHFELLPTKLGDARKASRTKTKSTVGSSHIRSQSLSEKTSTIGCSTCLLYTIKHLGLPIQESHQTVEGLHVLGIRLLHPSRQFLSPRTAAHTCLD